MSNVANNDTAATMARIAELEAMQAELKALKAKVKNTPRLKVSEKGCLCVYGLPGWRRPVALYVEQWEKIIELVEQGVFTDFIAQNESTLTRKGEAPLARPAVEDTPAPKKTVKKTKKTTAKKTSTNGPSDEDLRKIEALNARVAKMPASDLFE